MNFQYIRYSQIPPESLNTLLAMILEEDQQLFTASSSYQNGCIRHSVVLYNLFGCGAARFDFEEGQLVHDGTSGALFGRLTLRSGGNHLNGTTWYINIDLKDTDIVDPRTEIGQGSNLVETWTYFLNKFKQCLDV